MLISRGEAPVKTQTKELRLIQLAKSAKRDIIALLLEQISCPALRIWGKEDKRTPLEVAKEFHERIPNSELVWLDKCGHAPMMECPEEFCRGSHDGGKILTSPRNQRDSSKVPRLEQE
jgi:pimeloyl-ACP methyl ester carboxylesterase